MKRIFNCLLPWILLIEVGCAKLISYTPHPMEAQNAVQQLRELLNVHLTPPTTVEVTNEYLKAVWIGQYTRTDVVRFREVTDMIMFQKRYYYGARVFNHGGRAIYLFAARNREDVERFIDAVRALQ